MLEPGYEQPGHLLVFTDDRHIDRANVLMFQTPAIIPVVQIRRMRLAIGVHDEVGGELKGPRRRRSEQASDKSKHDHPSHLVDHSTPFRSLTVPQVTPSCRVRYQER